MAGGASVKPIESRGSYRVNEIAWSEKVYRVVSAESGEMGARFGLEGWPEKVVHGAVPPDYREASGAWPCARCCAEQSLPFRGQSRQGSAPPAW